jgi:8-oxo-dGTP pyrophosphatase MutT (NUDIX family)
MQKMSDPFLDELTPPIFRDLARRLLAPPESAHTHASRNGAPSDYDLDPAYATELETMTNLCPAAVLVPVIARPVLTLLFTERAGHLPAHAGQISFPGGKADEADASSVATALREAQEEIGLDAGLIEPLGYLDTYRTGTGFCISPVVALVDPAYSLTLNAEEVVDAFEVPLPFLMDARNHQTHVRTLGERERRFYAMPYGDHFIWGATAGILRNMHERLFKS